MYAISNQELSKLISNITNASQKKFQFYVQMILAARIFLV